MIFKRPACGPDLSAESESRQTKKIYFQDTVLIQTASETLKKIHFSCCHSIGHEDMRNRTIHTDAFEGTSWRLGDKSVLTRTWLFIRAESSRSTKQLLVYIIISSTMQRQILSFIYSHIHNCPKWLTYFENSNKECVLSLLRRWWWGYFFFPVIIKMEQSRKQTENHFFILSKGMTAH